MTLDLWTGLALLAAAVGGAVLARLLLVAPERRRLEQAANLRAEEARVGAQRELFESRRRDEEDLREARAVLARQEAKLAERDEASEARRLQLEAWEGELTHARRDVEERLAALDLERAELDRERERLAGLTPERAREEYMAAIEAEFRDRALERAGRAEAEVAADAERRARKVVLDVMQRSVVDYVSEATLAVVELPSEDMKGRIIGREGRNIRAFEQVTGVDLIVDETPEAVVISCFDPIRRETARLALMNLMVDGRIHPGRIEELYEKAQQEVDRMIRDAGERAADRAGVTGLPARVIETMGKLRFRTSFAQNVLDHSVEVSRLAAMLAAELGANVELARRAGLLHDIGKALGPEWEGPHAVSGMEYLRSMGEPESILVAVGAHHHDIEPTTPESQLVIVADSLSAARPGARRESLENYLKRLGKLEQIANDFPGVERSYAVHAGREIRLIVKPEEIDDAAAMRLATDVAERIERDLEVPGQVKVTVIRELRVHRFSK